jgi:hypothetical protein
LTGNKNDYVLSLRAWWINQQKPGFSEKILELRDQECCEASEIGGGTVVSKLYLYSSFNICMCKMFLKL